MKQITYFTTAIALIHGLTLQAIDQFQTNFTVLLPRQSNNFEPPASDEYRTSYCPKYRVTDRYTYTICTQTNNKEALATEKSLHISNDMVVDANENLVNEKGPKAKVESPRIDSKSPRKSWPKIYFMSGVEDQLLPGETLPEEIRPCPEGDSTEPDSNSNSDVDAEL